MGLAALFAACENNENEGPEGPEPREQVGRTVLVYIVGDAGDLNNELSSLFKINFSDMKAGMEEVDYSKCNLVVYSEMVNDVPHLISLKQKNGKVVADTLLLMMNKIRWIRKLWPVLFPKQLVISRQIVMGLYFCLIALHGCRPVIMRTLAPSDIIVGLR